MVAKIENFWGECHYVLKKLAVMQMFNEAPVLHGAQMSITLFTRTYQLTILSAI